MRCVFVPTDHIITVKVSKGKPKAFIINKPSPPMFWCSPSVNASTEIDYKELHLLLTNSSTLHLRWCCWWLHSLLGKRIISVPFCSSSASKNRPALSSPYHVHMHTHIHTRTHTHTHRQTLTATLENWVQSCGEGRMGVEGVWWVARGKHILRY